MESEPSLAPGSLLEDIRTFEDRFRRKGSGGKRILNLGIVACLVIIIGAFIWGLGWEDSPRGVLPLADEEEATPARPVEALPTSPLLPAPTPTIATAPTPMSAPMPTSTAPNLVPDHTEAQTEELRLFMLELINNDRVDNGLTPLLLGDNIAAQAHAEEIFREGFVGHWSLAGLKPYMRYTLSGGVGNEGENVYGMDEIRVPDARYATTPARESLREAQEALMSSPGHRKNILNSWHQMVNLGIVCDEVTCSVVQQFESAYVNFDTFPVIKGGDLAVLSFSGQLLDGFVYSQTQLWFDPPSETLLASQIRPLSCYSLKDPVMFIRAPLPKGSTYLSDSSEYSPSGCLEPRDIGVASPSVPWVDANLYEVQDSSFNIAVDISKYLQEWSRPVRWCKST